MLRLAEETNIEVLRQAALLLERENQRLVAKVVALTKKLVGAKGEDAQKLLLRISELEHQLQQRNRSLFGDSSEKRPGPGVPAEKQKKPKRGHGPRKQPRLKCVEKILDLDEADKQCPKCGGELAEMLGQFEESEEITVVARQFVRERIKRKKYRCGCNACIETALPPEKLFPGARYSIDFAIDVAIQKYLDHMPLERQVRAMKREGLEISSQTLWDYLDQLATLLTPLHELLHRLVLRVAVIGADETEWKLLRTKSTRAAGEEAKSKRWRVWAVASSEAVCYRIQEDRSVDSARALLRDYKGVVMCDGYKAYESLARAGGSFTVAHCLAHVRRKFIEIEKSYPVEAGRALELIGDVYAIERLCPTGPPGDALRLKYRRELSKPLMEKLGEFLNQVQAIPESGLARAVEYARSLWPGLIRFLENPRIPLDNNATERALRGIVVGRKNHYGSRSKRGTEVAALFYSVLETVKLAGVEPREYLRTAVIASLRGDTIPLPHEFAASATAA